MVFHFATILNLLAYVDKLCPIIRYTRLSIHWRRVSALIQTTQLFPLLFLWALQQHYGMNLSFLKSKNCYLSALKNWISITMPSVIDVRYMQGYLLVVEIWRLLRRFIPWISFWALGWGLKCCTYRCPLWGKLWSIFQGFLIWKQEKQSYNLWKLSQ